MKNKKIISLLIVLAMCAGMIGVLPVSAGSASTAYLQDFSDSAEFADECTAGMWNKSSDGVLIENGKLKITSGKYAEIDLTKLNLAADGSQYVISFDLSVDEWVNNANYNRLQVSLHNSDGYKYIFDELSYNDAAKAEVALLGQWKGANGTKSHSVKYVYTPSTGAINGSIGTWASQSSTWGAGKAPDALRFWANGYDTFYVDNLKVYKVTSYNLPYTQDFESSTGYYEEVANSLWNKSSDGVSIENGKIKITSGKYAEIDLTKLNLAADGTEYEISFDISVDEWANNANYNRLQVSLHNSDGYKYIFDELSYNDATKAEVALLGQWKGANGVKSHSLKYIYTPSTGVINGSIGEWATQSSTWGAGKVPDALRFWSNGADTFYVDNISISEAVQATPTPVPVQLPYSENFDNMTSSEWSVMSGNPWAHNEYTSVVDISGLSSTINPGGKFTGNALRINSGSKNQELNLSALGLKHNENKKYLISYDITQDAFSGVNGWDRQVYLQGGGLSRQGIAVTFGTNWLAIAKEANGTGGMSLSRHTELILDTANNKVNISVTDNANNWNFAPKDMTVDFSSATAMPNLIFQNTNSGCYVYVDNLIIQEYIDTTPTPTPTGESGEESIYFTDDSNETSISIDSYIAISDVSLYVAAYSEGKLVGIVIKDNINLYAGRNTINIQPKWKPEQRDCVKAFLLDENYAPVALDKSVELSVYHIDNLNKYEGNNGDWWICDFDTGIDADTYSSVTFRINPMTYYLEASFDSGTSWERLNCIADNSDITEYNYPLVQREILEGTIADAKNVFISSGDYRGSLIDVRDSVFDTVTITKGENSIGYAFLAARPEVYISSPKFPDGCAPSYAAGYTRVVYSSADEVTLTIPDNAKYLYIYNNSSNVSYVPSAIRFTKSENKPDNKNSVRIATWNIGHFSIGINSSTSIYDSDFASKAAEYEDYIYNVLDADVISLNEYSKMFTSSKSARDTVFGKYPTAFEGEQYNYSCNAFYSKADLTNIRQNEFECNKTANMESPYGINASDYYYVSGDLNLNGTTVKLVTVHLAFYAGSTSPNPPITENQINELIETFKDYDKVIIMGDWNCHVTKLNAFINAGYNLVNNDSTLPTYPAGPSSLDNFIYKGVTVSNFGLGGTNLSDHYAIYCTVTAN